MSCYRCGFDDFDCACGTDKEVDAMETVNMRLREALTTREAQLREMCEVLGNMDEVAKLMIAGEIFKTGNWSMQFSNALAKARAILKELER